MKPRIIAVLILTSAAAQAEDWLRFRGEQGQGISQTSIRTEWNATDGIAWSAELPGPGSSSPIVTGNRVFLTCYTGNGPTGDRRILCFDANTGKELWQQSVPAPSREDDYRGYLTEHGYASATPVSDGKNVYAFFGKAGVAAFTVDGKKLWHHDVGQMSSNRRWGSAASPVLHGEILIVNAAEEDRAIIGLNTADGSEAWRAEYDRLELCFATPVLVAGEGNATEAVISMPGEVWGLNPANGKLRWFCEIDNGGNVSPGVVVSNESFFTFGGYPAQQTNAIRRGGRKDISASHRVWQSRDSSYVATPLYFEKHLYWVSDRGQAFVANAESGETVERIRLTGLASGGRPVYASPVKAGDSIYVVTRRSGTFVFSADPSMRQVARNEPLDDSDFNGTPAISEGRMFIRSNKALYCIQ